MARRESRFQISYVQDDVNGMIIILKDTLTNVEYIEIVTDKGVAVTELKDSRQ